MDDFRIIFYIILGIIYLVIRATRGNKKKQQQPPRPTNQPTAQNPVGTGEAPKSFEDLLKQLGQEVKTEAPAPPPQPVREPAPQPKKSWYEIEEEERTLERIEPEFDEAAQRREREAQEAARRLEQIKHEANMIRNATTEKGRFEEFRIEEKGENYYANLLKNGDGIRDAIVLNAILNRPYQDE
ncbi:MAG TPA: hypothetical protein DCE41_02090 [Cytophagales bacterium]|nr:hypothetical protein [Cytophagales bacterium]HAA21269.1 hypothetical protein [Cytophagales bacterium]HAP63494.1 hypothetical protein [Cytophagales bacterium]